MNSEHAVMKRDMSSPSCYLNPGHLSAEDVEDVEDAEDRTESTESGKIHSGPAAAGLFILSKTPERATDLHRSFESGNKETRKWGTGLPAFLLSLLNLHRCPYQSHPCHPCNPWLPLLRDLCDLCGEMIGAIHLNSEGFRELGSVAPVRVRPLLHRILSKTVQFLVPPQKVKNNC